MSIYSALLVYCEYSPTVQLSFRLTSNEHISSGSTSNILCCMLTN